jgi:dTMP kinase
MSDESQPKKRGVLIVIEGIDRSGKTTQVKLLAKHLNAELIEFPDRTTETGQKIDDYLSNRITFKSDYEVHKLFSQNRWEKRQWILDTLNSGKDIVCGRYAYSGVAYSIAKGLDMNWCKEEDRGLPEPDFVFYLNVDPKIASERGGYGKEKYENLSFQCEVSKSFEHVFKGDNSKITRIDASKSKEYVLGFIGQIINQFETSRREKDIGRLWWSQMK